MIFHVLLTTEHTPAPFHDEKNKVAQTHSHMDHEIRNIVD